MPNLRVDTSCSPPLVCEQLRGAPAPTHLMTCHTQPPAAAHLIAPLRSAAYPGPSRQILSTSQRNPNGFVLATPAPPRPPDRTGSQAARREKVRTARGHTRPARRPPVPDLPARGGGTAQCWERACTEMPTTIPWTNRALRCGLRPRRRLSLQHPRATATAHGRSSAHAERALG